MYSHFRGSILNEAIKQIAWYPITAVWAHEDPIIVNLTIDGEVIETTPNHPFYTAKGEWIEAGDLQIGAKIRQADGSYGLVESVVFVERTQWMYNLTVAEAHTYFVGVGRWLVHNCTPPRFVIHYTSSQNYDSIVGGNFKLNPSRAEGRLVDPAPSGVYFGDADPPMTDFPYIPTTIQARWGVPGGTPDHFIMIDTTKLPQGTTWASREWPHSPGRPEWVLETSESIDVSSAVVSHGSINKLNE